MRVIQLLCVLEFKVFELETECNATWCRIKICFFRKPTMTLGYEPENLKETWYFGLETGVVQ